MKRINTFKQLLFVTLLCAAGAVNGQIHPLAFGKMGTAYTNANYYANYVGLRLEVVSPLGTPPGIGGDKLYTVTNDGGGGTGVWGSAVTTSITAKDIVMPAVGGDTQALSSMTASSMTGKIAFVYRGSNEFVCKALNCQNGGAIAIVIVNNVPGGPISMGAGTTCAASSILIPVFMISKADGDAIDAVYRGGTPVKLTITNWGIGMTNDLGFVPGGTALWHAYAVPSDQLTGTGLSAYKQVDGAFIANYGSAAQTNVKVSGTLSFTPTGSTTAAQLHTDTVKLPNFPTIDSVWAMFDTLTTNNEYDVTTSAGTGRFDLTYNVSATVADDYSADNTLTTSFYSTDSVYSKGRYDFTKNQPLRTSYRGGATTAQIWGDMLYVAKGGAKVSKVQYSLDATATGPFSEPGNNVYLFKWVDGDRGLTKDSIIQNGELELVGVGSKTFDGVNDTSGALLEVKNMGIDTTGAASHFVVLQSNTWYYLAIGVPPAYYLGCDGIMNPFPRIYGRYHAVNNIYDYSNMQFTESTGSVEDIYTNFAANNLFMPSDVSHLSIDSFNYFAAKGLLPAIAMVINKDTTYVPPIDHTLVNNATRSAIGLTVYPNPASEHLNVSLDLDKFATSVKYTLIDGLGRIVSETVHTNLQSEKYTINTSVLASGNYFLVVNANDKVSFKKFVVVR